MSLSRKALYSKTSPCVMVLGCRRRHLSGDLWADTLHAFRRRYRGFVVLVLDRKRILGDLDHLIFVVSGMPIFQVHVLAHFACLGLGGGVQWLFPSTGRDVWAIQAPHKANQNGVPLRRLGLWASLPLTWRSTHAIRRGRFCWGGYEVR